MERKRKRARNFVLMKTQKTNQNQLTDWLHMLYQNPNYVTSLE